MFLRVFFNFTYQTVMRILCLKTFKTLFFLLCFLQRSAAGMIDKPILNFGKRFAKEVNIHPDAMIQMAVQLAYYRMHQR